MGTGVHRLGNNRNRVELTAKAPYGHGRHALRHEGRESLEPFAELPTPIALRGCDFLNPKIVPITLRLMLSQKQRFLNRGNHTECDWYYKITASGRATRVLRRIT